MIVAIHQPNFFPWLGYFEKISRADRFIFLDDVQFPKSGAGVNSNRVKMLVSGEARWITASIARNFEGNRRINQVEFNASEYWREKMIKSLETNYKKAQYFDEVFSFLQTLIDNPESNVSKYNCNAILSISEKLGIQTNRFCWSSELPHVGNSNDLLVSLTKLVGGTAYLTGKGAVAYLDEAIYETAGVRLIHQDFVHPEYSQHNTVSFIAGLSIVDALMNIGYKGVAELLACS